MSNYPDDIRNYDSDPRSPFYIEPPKQCKNCGDNIKENKGFNPQDNEAKVYCSKICLSEGEGYLLKERLSS